MTDNPGMGVEMQEIAQGGKEMGYSEVGLRRVSTIYGIMSLEHFSEMKATEVVHAVLGFLGFARR